MNTSFQDIPFDFLLTWYRKHPEIGYVRTLAQKASCSVVGDIYSQELKPCKKLSELRDTLSGMTSELEAAYAAFSATHVLPSTPGLTRSQAISEFMSEYADIIEDMAKKSDTHKKSWEIRAKVFRLYNVPGTAITTDIRKMDYVATTVRLSIERVRQIYAELTESCRKIFLGETVDNIQAEPSLADWFIKLDAELATAMPLSKFRSSTGVDGSDPYAERFLMDILGVNVSDDKSRKQYVAKGNLAFAKDMGKVVKFFRDQSIPVPMNDFDVFLNKTFKDAAIRQNIRDYVLNDDDYEVSAVSDGQQSIALKWENLLFLPNEMVRILYDRKAFDVKDALSKDELFREYNTRAQILGKDTIGADTAGFGRHKLILALGKSGFYKIRKYKESFTDGQEFAREYVRANLTGSSLQDFIKLCEDKGYIHLYGEKTMTTYYYTASQPLSNKVSEKRTTTGLSAETVLKTTAEELANAGKPVQASALRRLVSARLGDIPDPSFRMYLTRAAGILFDLTPAGKKCLMVSLKETDIDSFDYSQFAPRTKEAAYKTAVMATAVDELRRAEGHKMKMQELVNKLKSLLPQGIAKTNIYKIFTDNDMFVKTSAGTKRGDLYVELNPAKYQDLYQKTATQATPEIAATVPAHFSAELYESGFSWPSLRGILGGQFRQISLGHGMNIRDILNEMYDIMRGTNKEVEEGTEEYKILSLLNNYYTSKTSPYDRELLAMKLVMGLEPYLRSFYRKVKGEELYGVKGLGTLIQKLQDEYYLPTDEDGTDIGQKLNSMIRNVITRRNKIHTNFEGVSGCSDVNYTMALFLKFYVLTAAYSLYYVE